MTSFKRLNQEFHHSNRRRGSARHFYGPVAPMHPERANIALWCFYGLLGAILVAGVIYYA